MSYRIRYGCDRCRPIPVARMLWVQAVASGVLLLLLSMVRLGGMDIQTLVPLLCSEPDTAGERAVYALSQALAEGTGWYQALAAWCRTVIDAGTV